jgi:hypothetical protein
VDLAGGLGRERVAPVDGVAQFVVQRLHMVGAKPAQLIRGERGEVEREDAVAGRVAEPAVARVFGTPDVPQSGCAPVLDSRSAMRWPPLGLTSSTPDTPSCPRSRDGPRITCGSP